MTVDALARVKAQLEEHRIYPAFELEHLRAVLARLEAAEVACKHAEALVECLAGAAIDETTRVRRASLACALVRWKVKGGE